MASEQSIYKYDVRTKKTQLLTVLKFPVEEIVSAGQNNQCFARIKASDVQYITEVDCQGDGWYLLDPVIAVEELGAAEKIATLAHFIAPEKLLGRTLFACDKKRSSFINITTNQTLKTSVSLSFFQSMCALYEEIDETSFSVRLSQQLFRQAQISADFRAYRRRHHEITSGDAPVPFIIPHAYRHFCRPMYDQDGYACTGELC